MYAPKLATMLALAMFTSAPGAALAATSGPFNPPPIVPKTPPVISTQPQTPDIPPPRQTPPRIPPNFQTPVPTDISRLPRQFDLPQIRESINLDGHYIFALSTCNGATDRNKGCILFPVRGTLYAKEESGVKLARGRMLVMSEGSKTPVQAGGLQVVVEPGSSAIVETLPGGITRVMSVAAYERSRAVNVSFANGHTVTLQPGQMIVSANHDILDEELIPADGIAQRVVEGAIAHALPHNVKLSEFSLRHLTNKNMLIACRPLDIHPSNKAGQALKNLHEQVQALAAQQDFAASAPVTVASDNSTRAVSTRALRAPLPYETVVSNHKTNIICQRNSVYKLSPDVIDLELGTLLVNSKSPLTVKGMDSRITVSKDATALVQFTGAALKIINLSDFANDSVSVLYQGQSLKLRPGKEVVITRLAPALGDVYDIHDIGHHATHSQQVGDTWLTVSEVNLQDELLKQPLLTSLRRAQPQQHKRIFEQVCRTAAIMNMVGVDGKAFVTGQPDDSAPGGQVTISGHCQSCGV